MTIDELIRLLTSSGCSAEEIAAYLNLIGGPRR